MKTKYVVEDPIQETDPNGLDQREAGAKLDAGKMRPSLVLDGFANALTAVIEVATYGADKKYTEGGWSEVSNGVSRYTNAMQRHMLGESTNPTHRIAHAAQLAWNALARLELMIRRESDEIDPSTVTHTEDAVLVFERSADALDGKAYYGHIDRNVKYVWQSFGVISETNAKRVAELVAKSLGNPALATATLMSSAAMVPTAEVEGEKYWARTKRQAKTWNHFAAQARIAVHLSTHHEA